MFELYFDNIDIAKSKQKKKLVYKKHDWLDELNIPLIISIFPMVWFIINLSKSERAISEFLLIHITSILLLEKFHHVVPS